MQRCPGPGEPRLARRVCDDGVEDRRAAAAQALFLAPAMKIVPVKPGDFSRIEKLFVRVFTASEGAAEGAWVGGLAKQLAAGCGDREEVSGFAGLERGQLVGAVFFSRFALEGPFDAFLLSPVAVDGDFQRKGFGQALIAHGLDELARRGVRLVLTYGDPAFYGKVGFAAVSPEVIQPPFPLSQSEGWLGRSLGDDSLETFAGRGWCVEALADPACW